MNISKALEVVSTLSVAQLQHFLQLAEEETRNYRLAIANYPPDRLRDYGEPYLQKLLAREGIFRLELEFRRADP